MALQMAHRRDPDGLVVEVRTEKAVQEGALFLSAGGPLYLARAIAPSSLVLPLTRKDDVSKTAEKKREKAARHHTAAPVTPGSFFVREAYFQDATAGSLTRGGAGKPRSKRKPGADWKRESRKERGKRDI
jgi:hypothetical protein